MGETAVGYLWDEDDSCAKTDFDAEIGDGVMEFISDNKNKDIGLFYFKLIWLMEALYETY